MKSDPLRAYKSASIKTASQGQLIVMLYDGGLRQLKLAVKEMNDPNPKLDKIHNAIIKTQDIITELMASLDLERGGEIASSLLNLYVYFNQQLTKANLSKSSENLKEVLDHMRDLRDAWASVEKESGHVKQPEPAGLNLSG